MLFYIWNITLFIILFGIYSSWLLWMLFSYFQTLLINFTIILPNDRPLLCPSWSCLPVLFLSFFFLATLLTIKPSRKSAYNHGNQKRPDPFHAHPHTLNRREMQMAAGIFLGKGFCEHVWREGINILLCRTALIKLQRHFPAGPCEGKFRPISTVANWKGHPDTPGSWRTTIWLKLYN